MKEIQLTRGKFAIVDDEDFDYLSKWNWQLNNHGYAVRKTTKAANRKVICMHRELLGLISNDGLKADHINGNTIDNRKENLRIATTSENGFNQKISKKNTSGFKGVSFNKETGKWVSYIQINKKTQHLGFFESAESAYASYCENAIKYYGEFANLGSGCVILGATNADR